MRTVELDFNDVEVALGRDAVEKLERYVAEKHVLVPATAGPGDQLTGQAGRWHDLVLLEQRMLGREPRECKLLQRPEVRKALDTTTAGSGLEYVPTAFSEQFVLDVQQEAKLAAAFPRVPMPTKTLTLPCEGADPTCYLVGDNVDLSQRITESSPGTRSVTLTAKTLAARTVESSQFEEDALPTALELVRRKLIRACARAIENAIVNGDTSETHMDADVTSATDVRKAWIGLRKKALTDTSGNVDLGTFNAEALLSLKSKAGAYGMDLGNACWVVGTAGYHKLLGVKDSAGNPVLMTVDRYGPQATVITGEIGRLFGLPVIHSPFVREDLNPSGVYDGSTTTKTVLLLAWRPAWVLGIRRDVTLEAVRHPGPQAVELVATVRADFAHGLGNALTTVMGYNLATA